jgi:hypothetical protein
LGEAAALIKVAADCKKKLGRFRVKVEYLRVINRDKTTLRVSLRAAVTDHEGYAAAVTARHVLSNRPVPDSLFAF